jgi:hypothetical protein
MMALQTTKRNTKNSKQVKLFALISALCIGCTVNSAQQTQNPPQCQAGEFSGFGIDEAAALSDLSKQIKLSVKVSAERILSQQKHNGNENLAFTYKDTVLIESTLPNANDARIIHNKQSSVVVCMSKANAAKNFLKEQKLIADSLEMISIVVLKEVRPKIKYEAWHKTQMLWSRFMGVQNMLEGLEAGDYFDLASNAYSKAREDYKDYCQNAKLHWNPEQENFYSELAFSKLSSRIKMEKSPCKGRGISLAHKGIEECMAKFGLNSCSYTQSLSISLCDGTEYLQFKNDIMAAHQKSNFALENLHSNLESADFWDKWAQELKEWIPRE